MKPKLKEVPDGVSGGPKWSKKVKPKLKGAPNGVPGGPRWGPRGSQVVQNLTGHDHSHNFMTGHVFQTMSPVMTMTVTNPGIIYAGNSRNSSQ